MDFILSSIESGKLFGAVEVDIEVPSKWPKGKERECTPTEYFSEMSPFFCTTEIGFEVLGDHMQEHVRRCDLSTVSIIIIYIYIYL